MSKKGFIHLILLVVVVAVILIGGGLFLYSKFQSNKTEESPQPPPLDESSSTEPKNVQSNTSLRPVYIGDYDVVVKIKESNCQNDYRISKCTSDIYLKDKNTGKETFFMTLDNIRKSDVRVPQYKSGYVFLIKRTGNDEYPSSSWTDELWVYTQQNQGQKIYDDKGYYFNPSPDGSLVAISPGGFSYPFPENKKFIEILSLKDNWKVKSYSIDMSQCIPDEKTREWINTLEAVTWQNNTQFLWGDFAGEYDSIGCYWALSPSSSSVDYYPTDKAKGLLFGLNPDKLVALYTSIPPIVDADTGKQWRSDHPTYSLYLYHIKTGTSTVIDTISSNFQNISANWDTPTQLSYQTPKGKVIYKLPE